MLFLPILGLIGSLCLPHRLAPIGQLLCPRYFFDTHLPSVWVSPEFRSYGIVCPSASAGSGPLPASLLLLMAWNQRWNKVQIMWKHCHDMLICAQVSLASLWYPMTRKFFFFDLNMHLWISGTHLKTTSTSGVGVRVIALGVGPPASSGTPRGPIERPSQAVRTDSWQLAPLGPPPWSFLTSCHQTGIVWHLRFSVVCTSFGTWTVCLASTGRAVAGLSLD